MDIEDLSFEVEIDGKIYKCDVLEVIPNSKNSDEPYVVYTNYDLDENDEFLKFYGRLTEENDQFNIETNLTEEEMNYIDITREDEIVKYVNDSIQDALNG